MSITISLNPQTMEALTTFASDNHTTCEEVASHAIEQYLMSGKTHDEEYDAWFKAQVEKGMEAVRCGDVCTHADVQRDMADRRAMLLAKIAEK